MEKNMKLLIGADTVPTAVNFDLYKSGDKEALFGDICKLAEEADRVIINLECALTESGGAIKKFGPNIKCPPECVNGLKALGVTDVLLSNNHVFDFGKQGLIDTVKALEDADLPYTGIGNNDTDSRKPYYFEHDGKRIGIVNVCEHEYTYALPNRMGANPFDPFLTMQDIRAAKAVSDFVIVVYHGGKEYCRYPSPRLVNLAHEMVLCGASAVLMQHSHCVGCYENFEGGHIVYGQGNFNFVYPNEKLEEWYTALLVELDIDKGVDISFHPIVQTKVGCDLATGEKATEILGAFAKRNEEMKDGRWQDGWHAFCMSPDREVYYRSLNDYAKPDDDGRNKELFAHFLDCEAHTDVWREINKTWNHTNE
jgi:poly-gamma-glutamate synthesis protein (capsule biosynthesis protein)